MHQFVQSVFSFCVKINWMFLNKFTMLTLKLILKNFSTGQSQDRIFMNCRCLPHALDDSVEAWRISPFFILGLVLWKLIQFAMSWSVQKERNERIFRHSESPPKVILSAVILQTGRWDIW